MTATRRPDWPARARHELERVRPSLELNDLLRNAEDDPTLFCLLPGDTTWERRVLRPIEVLVRVVGDSELLLERTWEQCVRPTLAFDAPGARAVFVWELDAQGRPTRGRGLRAGGAGAGTRRPARRAVEMAAMP